MDIDLLAQLNAERTARRAAVLVTDLSDGSNRLVKEGEAAPGSLGPAVERAFRTGKSTTVETDGREYFINAHLPPPRLVMIGAVHISQALAPMAQIAGFDMRVIDPRTAFATAERFEGADLQAEWPDEALEARPLDPFTALAAVTHDPKIDDGALKAALDAGCFYVGALGSRKTHAKRVARLSELGVEDAMIARIASPIGLDIGASSPQEIAVAILAEVISALRKRQVAAH